jgi:polysaccharide biosynthesis protein VpsM
MKVGHSYRTGINAIALAVFGSGAMSPAVFAVEPASINLGPVYIEPTLDVDLSWVDNLYRTRSERVDSWILKTTPQVKGWLQNNMNTYGLLYQLDDTRYSGTPDDEDDDYTDHLFRGDVHHEFNAKNLLALFAQHNDTHEERGTGLTEGRPFRVTDKPIEYIHSSYGGEYTYGNRQTTGRIQVELEGEEYEYQNFRDFTQYYDYDKEQVRGTFYWNMSSRTALLLEGRYLQTEYERQRPDQSQLDAEELAILVGMTWEASAKTRGSVKIGGYEREFDADDRDTSNGWSWDVHLNYRPRTYSIFDITARQVSRETNGLGNYIDTNEFSLNWLHSFTRGYRSNFNMMLANDVYEGTDRDDIRLGIEWAIDKNFRRWLDMGVGWRYEDRDSDFKPSAQFRPFADSLSYQRQSVFFRAKISL